jgi:hypothetical protein
VRRFIAAFLRRSGVERQFEPIDGKRNYSFNPEPTATALARVSVNACYSAAYREAVAVGSGLNEDLPESGDKSPHSKTAESTNPSCPASAP